jgi:hypothetical protein
MHVYHGYGGYTCGGAPGTSAGGEGEANLDALWANALAPSANLVFMSCKNGFNASLTVLIDSNLGDVIGISWGFSELSASPATYTAHDTLYAQAAAQGQTVFVAAGDSGSDTKDQNTSGTATSGLNIDAYADSPLVTATGATDFSDNYDSGYGGPSLSTYWGAANSAYFADALSYVPETTWNASCASSITAIWAGNYTPAEYCGQGDTSGYFNESVIGGAGGYSAHYTQPSWQSGVPGLSAAATMRAIPDISMFGSSAVWGHATVVCDSLVSGTGCTSNSDFGAAGGTSFVAPELTGIGGLLVSYTGSRQGLWNPALYALAKAQFTAAATKTSCYSNGQTDNAGVTTGLPASSCIFNDITTSNNDVPCAEDTTDCYVAPSASGGLLSTTGASLLTIAYPAGPGYDLATGLGSINVNNLITNWNKAFTSTTALGASPASITDIQSTTLTATVTGGTPAGYASKVPAVTGTVSFAAGSTALGNCTLSAGTCNLPVAGSALAMGANSVTATYAGNKTYPASTSTISTVTVTPSILSQTITFNALPNVTYGVSPITLGATASSGLAVSYAVTGPATLSSSTLTITGAGPVTVTASQAGNGSYSAATPVQQSFTVAPATLTVTANNASRVYGAANPAFSYAITNFVNGDTLAVVSGTATETTAAIGTSPNGSYPISFSTKSLTATNYTFTYVNGTLTVSGGAAQTITFGALSGQTYGASPITLGATASSGLTVSYSVSGPATLSGSKLTITGTGLVTVTASQAGNGNYAAATQVQQSFTVNPAVLTVTANNATRVYGAANPAFSYAITNFVNGDTLAVVSGTATETTTAIGTSPNGSYPISFSTKSLTATNYTFNYVNGTLTVTGAPVVVLTTTVQLAKVSGGYQATITVLNSGTGPAANVQLNTATLGAASGTPTPQNLGTLAAAGGSATVTVNFPATAGSTGATVVEKYAGTYTGGSFSTSLRAVLPVPAP